MKLRMGQPQRSAIRVCSAITLIAALGALMADVSSQTTSKQPDKATSSPAKKAESTASKPGLSINDPRAYQGYTLLAPLMTTKIFLIDMQGKLVHEWNTKATPGASTYLLENGHLLRTGTLMGEEQKFGGGPGAGGRVQELDWDGNVLWDYKLFTTKQLPHHDVTRLPNGNVLMIVWDKKTPQEALAAGRRPELNPDNHLLPDSLIEVKPTGKSSGEIVWEWHMWDHLVQDFDKTKANYGNVSEHPELVNMNYGEDALAPAKTSKDQQDKLKSIGYVGANTPSGRPPRRSSDWTHCNAVAYNPELDQIILSVHAFSEFWVLDHSTTTKEAAGHTGGRQGKGGDILYRFGNPLAYRAGTKKDQRLFAQHNPHWIPAGLPGAGHVMVFNNGNERPDGSYSSVDELALPVDSQGKYARDAKGNFEPARLVWSYTAPKKKDFYSFFISGAQRLANGNTLICAGASGMAFEVTPDNEVVWKYVNPIKGTGPMPGGGAPAFTPPQPGQLLMTFLQDQLKMTGEQKKKLGDFQKDLSGKIDKLLTAEQKDELKKPPKSGPGAAMSFPQPGQILSPGQQTSLKLTADQRKQLRDLQKEADDKLDSIFTDDQKKQFKAMRANPGRGFGPGGGGGGPPGIETALFRAYRFAPNEPALAGKELKPGKLLEELQPREKKKSTTP
jgi:hypothetical protein